MEIIDFLYNFGLCYDETKVRQHMLKISEVFKACEKAGVIHFKVFSMSQDPRIILPV